MKNIEAINRRFGKNDILFLLGLAVAVTVFLVFFYRGIGREKGNRVVVTVDGKEYGSYRLNEDGEIRITDETGEVTNILTIRDGYADMTDADCPDKLCVRQNRISHNRENIVCLPNKVVVTVEAAEDSDIDAIVE